MKLVWSVILCLIFPPFAVVFFLWELYKMEADTPRSD